MADSKERLDAMKQYCDRAIRLEREVDFWNDLINKADQKLNEYKDRQMQLHRVMSESEAQLISLGDVTRQRIEQKSVEIQMYKRKGRKPVIVLWVIVLAAVFIAGGIGIVLVGSGQQLNAEQGILLIVSIFFAVLMGMSIPIIICIIIYALNKSKQKNLMKEINQNVLDNESRRKKAILQDKFEKAEKESGQIALCQQILLRQQRELAEIGREAGVQRARFYAQGELPKTFQNLEAVISFFYYLDNKIVNEIDGADGMYNKYHLDCQHREHMSELRGIRHAIEEHERHEQMRHRELMGRLGFYGTVISAQLGQIGSDVREIRNIQRKIWDQ